MKMHHVLVGLKSKKLIIPDLHQDILTLTSHEDRTGVLIFQVNTLEESEFELLGAEIKRAKVPTYPDWSHIRELVIVSPIDSFVQSLVVSADSVTISCNLKTSLIA